MIEDSNRAPSSAQPQSSAASQVPADGGNADGGNQDKSWQELAEEASQETDPQKLLVLVKDLCSALDGENKPPANSQDSEIDTDGRSPKRPAGSI